MRVGTTAKTKKGGSSKNYYDKFSHLPTNMPRATISLAFQTPNKYYSFVYDIRKPAKTL